MKILILPCTAIAITAVTATAVQAQDAFVTTDRTVANGNPFNGTYANVTIGRLMGGGARVSGVNADIIAPTTVSSRLFTYSDSVTNLQGGTFNEVQVIDTSRITLTGTAAADRFIVDDGTSLSVTGGNVTGTNGILARGANVEVTGGFVSLLNANGGTGISAITIRAGTVGASGSVIRRNGSGVGLVNAKYETTLTISGGSVNGLQVDRGITIVQNGATINGGIRVQQPVINIQDTISTRITGGAVNGSIVGLTDAGVSVSGGIFDSGIDGRTFATLGRSTIAFTGTNLVLSAPTATTWAWDGFTYTGDNYILTGTLADGTSINRVLFDQTGTGNTGGFSVINVAASAPEPSGQALLAPVLLGGVWCKRRRRA